MQIGSLRTYEFKTNYHFKGESPMNSELKRYSHLIKHYDLDDYSTEDWKSCNSTIHKITQHFMRAYKIDEKEAFEMVQEEAENDSALATMLEIDTRGAHV
jgi:hypothetical protein